MSQPARFDRAPSVILSGDLSSFFREALEEARRAGGYEGSAALEAYLVALLSEQAHSTGHYQAALERPVTLLLAEARHHQGRDRFDRLRLLGDGVLYVSGFFAEHLERRGVQQDYVSAVGARAYWDAAAMLPSGAPGSVDVIVELARGFRTLVAWLRDVAERLAARAVSTDADRLRLYERWRRTGSGVLLEALVRQGVAPVRAAGGLQ